MYQAVTNIVESRISDVEQTLLETNAAYAVAAERSALLYDQVEPILQSGDDLQISAGDCLSFREYLEMEEKTNGLLRQEAYKQGWRDSARLLCLLGR